MTALGAGKPVPIGMSEHHSEILAVPAIRATDDLVRLAALRGPFEQCAFSRESMANETIIRISGTRQVTHTTVRVPRETPNNATPPTWVTVQRKSLWLDWEGLSDIPRLKAKEGS